MTIDFSSLNFETLDSNINAYPDMFVNQNGITFTKRVLEDMGYPPYVVCMIDPKARVFAIKGCKGNEAKAFKFAKSKGDQSKAACTIMSKNVLDPIRRMTEDIWKPGIRYKVTGFWVAEAKTMCFDLNEGKQEVYRVNFAGTESGE